MIEDRSTLTFEPPGPGTWMLDTTHNGRRPLTRYMQGLYLDPFSEGMGQLLEKYGLPIDEFRTALVRGCFYVRPIGVGEPDEPRPDPPAFVMWLVARMHPELRRRNRTAAQAWAERRWRREVDRWFATERATAIETNLALQDIDLQTLDDGALTSHIEAAVDNFSQQLLAGMAGHGGDLVPVGDYLAHCNDWAIEPAAAAGLLQGASPASVETAEILRPVGQAIAAASIPPSSVDDVRALDPAADRAVDDWLRLHAYRLVTSSDLDGITLAERPDLQLRTLLAARQHPPAAHEPNVEPVRQQTPANQRSLFDTLLAEARHGLSQRDDRAGLLGTWPTGLLRHALLEAGRRLNGLGALDQRDQIFELTHDEVKAFLTGQPGPDPAEIAERCGSRQAVIDSEPPSTLGPAESPPPLHLFPAPLARATRAMLSSIEAMEGQPFAQPLHGTGIGTTAYTGRAVVGRDPLEVVNRLQPGDVIVAPFTGPSWNSLLPACGALVVEEGGVVCHAAIVAREFDIPAIIGATDATAHIPDGATITVDPVTGTVSISA